nr:reverse transcriptase domain-containing protein [Tanacetum cinerariifolium]
MAAQRTMVELLHAPTEGYAEPIVVPPILAEQFELKQSLINMMTTDQGSLPMARKRTPERYKDLLRACPHHGFTELHQLDTFYNALNPADQDSLNAAVGGNFLERSTQDVLTIIKKKSKCLAAGGNTFLELRDNIQGYVSAAVVNYNQGNSIYRHSGMASQIRPPGFAQPNVQNNQNRFAQPQGLNNGNNFNPEQSYQVPTQQNQNVPLNELEKVKRMNEANMKAMQTQINMVKNELKNEMKNSIQASLSNQTNEIKNMMASFFQMNIASTLGSGTLPSNTIANPKGKFKAITTQSGIVLDGPTVPTPPPFINPEEDERAEETLTDLNLSEYTIKVPPPPIKKYKPPSYSKNLETLGNFPFRVVSVRADLGACINLMPLYVWKKLGLPERISTCMTLKLANRAICTPDGIARDVFIPVGKFTFPADFVIVDYEIYPRVPLILGRPFLRTSRALIDVHGEEMIFHDGDERLTLNIRHDTSSYSNQPQKESINLINVFNNSSESFLEDLFSNQPKGGNVLPKKLLDLDSTKDLHPPLYVHSLSGSTTYSYSSSPLLEEFTDELALITFPPKYDDDLQFDVDNLANPADNFFDSMPEMFIDEHAPDYSFPLIFDEYDDDFLEVESDIEYVYDDPFDFEGEKIKVSKLLIDELDLPCDFLPSEYDSFISQDFSRVDALPSTNNEDKVFNPGILIQEKPFKIITFVVQDKKPATSNASLVLEDFDPPFYEPLFFKEVPRLILPNSCVTWLSVCTIDRPMRNKDAATWDGGKSTWGGWARGFGTVPDLVSKFINEFFPPSRTTNLRNEISNFQQRFDESFHEAWDRYKDLLRACPHYGFTKLHQLDTFYNALNTADQDSLNAAGGGNLLERKIAKLTHAVNQQTNDVTTAKTAILKQFQATSPPASVKAVEETCVTCGGAHPYYQCLTAGGNTFPEFRDNIQGYVSAAAVNYNQGNPGYRPSGSGSLPSKTVANPKSELKAITTRSVNQQTSAVTTAMTAILKQFQATPPPASVKAVEEICLTCGDAHPYYQCLAAGGNTFPKHRDNIQGYVAAAAANYNQGNSVYRPLGSGSLPSNTIANPKGKLKAITTRSGIVFYGPSIPIPPPFINSEEDERVEETLTDQDLADNPFHPNIPYPSRMLKQKQQEKDEVQIPKFWQMFKQLHINITLADALILIPKYQKMLKALLSNKEKLLELANTPHNENCSAIPPYLDIHGEEMILRDGDERLTLNMRHDTSSYSNQPQKKSINLINVFNDSRYRLYSQFDSIDQSNLANLSDNLVDFIPEMCTDEHALDYSSPPIYAEYDDDLLEVESDTEYVLDDPFDSKREKIRESKLLIDELDLPCDFLLPSEYDSFLSKDFFEVDALP